MLWHYVSELHLKKKGKENVNYVFKTKKKIHFQLHTYLNVANVIQVVRISTCC